MLDRNLLLAQGHSRIEALPSHALKKLWANRPADSFRDGREDEHAA